MLARSSGYSQLSLDVKPEVDHVAILDHVLLAFQAPFAGFLGSGFAVVLNEVVEGDDFGADKAFLEVGVDHAGGLGCGGTDLDRPGTDFLYPGSEVGL